ncbi:hypothetical protein PanWU01x14_117270 [Parasponia andersonii]|uniref:Uncharacterized protein n=1 Tax=Parasponia andersonii TaxID=3476 RepID=A0A2P5CWI7_PARAD|nr:hypothetical protein PanWU01x14_117270 [Parasponia andersonii]
MVARLRIVAYLLPCGWPLSETSTQKFGCTLPGTENVAKIVSQGILGGQELTLLESIAIEEELQCLTNQLLK